MKLPSISFTPYRIKRDHDNHTTFFVVDVPEAKQHGVGFQMRMGEYVVGMSITLEFR
jgi:hypothetical protein